VRDVGTLAWARRSGGRLEFADRVALARRASAQLVRNLPALVVHRLGLQRRYPPPVDPDALVPPDSAAARAAETELRELAPPYMVHHSLRTYWFSRLLGEASGLAFDDEVLYVASLAHDLGFFGPHARATPDAECFTIRGADAALALAARHGWEPARAERAAEAITFHVNGAVALDDGHEAFLMQRGVLLDVAGMYAWDLDPRSVRAVFGRHPLLDQREQLWPTFRREANDHPRCRGHFANRWLGFGLLVRLSPWR